MKKLFYLLTLVALTSCLQPTNLGPKKGTEESQSAAEVITPASLALSSSEPVSNAIIAEKNLILKTASLTATKKNEIESVAKEIPAQTAAKGEELFVGGKSIIDCAVTKDLATCTSLN